MATNIVKQSVLFIAPDVVIDEAGIFNDPLVKALAQNSIGNDIIFSYVHFKNLSGGIWIDHIGFEITCFVLPTFVATIQTNIPSLQVNWPGYTVVTYSGGVFG